MAIATLIELPILNHAPLFDGGDVRDNADGTGPGSWYGDPMCCLACYREEGLKRALPMETGVAGHYVVALTCANCGEPFVKWRV